ncbi:L-serine ammonia-lyase, iron-sulfur-dependent, subunit alpha [Escherichia coli]|nr:L-serine ammonia-lyase, iron-sulfur-dependent, subunit alpha [Escherichia coli]
MISLFDMFKVGIGPSSSHTVGPMKAGKQFVDDLVEKGLLDSVTRVAVDVYGSLSLTGKGHHTDIAIIMGLAGNEPATVDIDSIPGFIRDVEERERLLLAQGRHEVDFPRDNGMRFHNGNLPLHENGMQIHAYNGDEVVYSKTYYSIGGGGRVVTAPTNGACGIVPAVLAYYDHFIESVSPDIYTRYFMAAGAIGALYKMNASISGAEVGCQGEVGVACSMAAAGLAELLGGSPEQVCVAAEIGMEHNLGLTCDPVAGQVQVPCIERNAIASVKAINAARMALRRTSAPRVSLDKVIETMYETGKDMNAKYRETSRGGLAIKVQCD